MWIVLSYKIKEINTLKKNLSDMLGMLNYFVPQVKYHKNLGNKFKIIKICWKVISFVSIKV